VQPDGIYVRDGRLHVGGRPGTALIGAGKARKLAEGTDAPLKTVAFKRSFHNATHRRTTFSQRLNVTPKQYRIRFRGEAGAQP
jgi:methylphosphotriester-DNA--protein-cysteine methyltransferase